MTPQRRRDNSPFRPNAPPLPVGPEYYDRALELVNYFRMQGNAPFVEMGRVPAAQRHADDCLAMGMSSQWNLDGLKPYMRYSLAGGYQATSVFSWSRPEPAGITDLELMIEEGSPGCSRLWGTAASSWTLCTAGSTSASRGTSGILCWLSNWRGITSSLMAARHQQWHSCLCRKGQERGAAAEPCGPVGRCLVRPAAKAAHRGTTAAGERLRPRNRRRQSEASAAGRAVLAGRLGAMTIERHAAPEDFPPDSPVPSNPEEIRALLQEAYHRGERPRRVQASFPRVTCGRWDVSSDGFAVAADIGGVWREYGAGGTR